MRKDSKKLDDFTVNGEKRLETLFENNDGAFELELQLVSAGKEAGFELLNSLGEKVKILFGRFGGTCGNGPCGKWYCRFWQEGKTA